MKKLLPLLIVLICVRVAASVAAPAATFPLKWAPPKGWRSETIPFPLDFAPQIKFTGVEELRFSPGFRDPAAYDYFTYAFVWLIDDNTTWYDWKLPSLLRDYFAGLMREVNQEKKWPGGGVTTRASMSTEPSQTPLVVVQTWDAFFTGKPLTLTVRMYKLDTHLAGKRLLYYEVSPKMDDERVIREFAGVKGQLQP